MIIEKYDLGEKVEVILEEDQIVLRPIQNVRDGWGSAFVKMRAAGDDELLMDDFTDEDHPEEWK
jgi:antitoxin MazE